MGEPLRAFFEREFTSIEFLDFAVVKLTTAYAACRKKDNPDGPVFGVVILMHHYRDQYENFCYKEMEEGQGPNEDDCPARILKLLSPLEKVYDPGSFSHEWAGNWRARCHAKLDQRKTRPKIKDGDRVRFPAPFEFSDGEKVQEFIYRNYDRKVRFFRPLYSTGPVYDYGTYYRIPNWRDLPYTIVESR
jgi:hypothetical protein